mgnify:CR=1 FL=1
MTKRLDTYEQWEADGILEDKIKLVKELVSKRIIQKEIAKALNVSERLLIKMKKEHPRLKQAYIDGDGELKYKLLDSVYQKAIGFEYEETQTVIEETKSGTKKKIVKNKKRSLPDFNALKYLLIIKFGREYNERKEEIDILYKRAENNEEVWMNETEESERPIVSITKKIATIQRNANK